MITVVICGLSHDSTPDVCEVRWDLVSNYAKLCHRELRSENASQVYSIIRVVIVFR